MNLRTAPSVIMPLRVADVPTPAFSTLAIDDNNSTPGAETSRESSEDGSAADHGPLLLRPFVPRPESQRSVTDPSPSFLLQGNLRPSSSHRNRSPYARSHLRSRSTGAALSAPTMTRARSSPAMHTAATRAFDLATPSFGSLSPGSPMRSPARQRSPFRLQDDYNNNNNGGGGSSSSSNSGSNTTATATTYVPPPRSPSYYDSGSGAIESIQEDIELDLTPRASSLVQSISATASFSRSSSLRRRPASPLHSVANAPPPTSVPSPSDTNTAASSASNSPAFGPQRYTETFPILHHYPSSSSFGSIPSTPTSQRSRSPSISSLDTIEDVPDLESQAIEAERIERLKLAAERAEHGELVDDFPAAQRRGSFDGGGRGFGFTRGGSRERKRWSVCGGERRVDLDLDTIWED